MAALPHSAENTRLTPERENGQVPTK